MAIKAWTQDEIKNWVRSCAEVTLGVSFKDLFSDGYAYEFRQVIPTSIRADSGRLAFASVDEANEFLARENETYEAEFGERSPWAELEKHYPQNADESPIIVLESDGALLLSDGYHRLAAAVIFGMERIPAIVLKRQR